MNEHLHIQYDDLKALWHQALMEEARLISMSEGETLGILSLGRQYSATVMLYDYPRPVCVSSEISWGWSALDTARTYTTEDDALTEFIGGSDVITEPIYIPTSIKFVIGISSQSRIPLPDNKVWAAWHGRVVEREFASRFPRVERKEPNTLPLAWHGPLEISQRYDNGQWFLERITLPAGEEVQIPRHWDWREEVDDSPLACIVGMATRIRSMVEVMERSLPQLFSQQDLKQFGGS